MRSPTKRTTALTTKVLGITEILTPFKSVVEVSADLQLDGERR